MDLYSFYDAMSLDDLRDELHIWQFDEEQILFAMRNDPNDDALYPELSKIRLQTNAILNAISRANGNCPEF